jgi:hypothetical protein
MKNQHKNALPLLVTLAGCVLMLAWVDPVHATEVTRQLTQKGYGISQLRKSEVAIVKNANHDLKVVFKSYSVADNAAGISGAINGNLNTHSYHFVFPNRVKAVLKADIRTWMKRE